MGSKQTTIKHDTCAIKDKDIKCYVETDNYHQKFKELYESNVGDFIIIGNSKNFVVDCTILSTNSSLFRSLLLTNMEEKKLGQLDYSKYDDVVIDIFLRYLYYRAEIGDIVNNSLSSLERSLSLMELFDMHMLEDAKAIMLNKFTQYIETIIEMAQISQITNLTSPKEGRIFFEEVYRKCLTDSSPDLSLGVHIFIRHPEKECEPYSLIRH